MIKGVMIHMSKKKDNNKIPWSVKIFECILILTIILLLSEKAYIPTIFISIFLLLFSLIIYGSNIADYIEKKKLQKIAIKNDKNNIQFYREMIENYSIGELAFLDGYDLEYPKDIIAILLKLKLKGYIQIENNKISILNNNIQTLKKSEQYIFQSIKNNKIELENTNDLINILKEECIQDKLIHPIKSYIGYLIIGAGITIFLFITLWILLLTNSNRIPKSFFDILISITVIFFIILWISVVLIISYDTNLGNKNRWKLTNTGHDIYIKLIGLKKFLKGFSIIHERDIKELLLWEDYLIYSVMFGLNKDIISNYKELIVILNKD